MNEVIVVHVLCVKEVAILFLAQILWVDAIGTQELLVCHTESLADRLSYELSLNTNRNQVK